VKVSLIICNKNEGKSLRSIIRASKKYVTEVIVIDGHSTDDSEKIVKKEHVRFMVDNGKGKGAAIRLGIDTVEGDVLVFMDADGSHEPNDIPKLTRLIIKDQADLTLASRTKGGSDELSGSLEKNIRMLGSLIITTLIDIRFKTNLTDTQNGFRAIRRSAAMNLNLKENTFTIEQEMIMKALRKGYRIAEIPSHERTRVQGRSHIRLCTTSWRYVWCLIRNII
jgi:glycosyltransferase involved in cell wall biosynthesis